MLDFLQILMKFAAFSLVFEASKLILQNAPIDAILSLILALAPSRYNKYLLPFTISISYHDLKVTIIVTFRSRELIL